MVRAPKGSSQDQWSSGARNPVAQREGNASAAPHKLRRLALCMSVIGASLWSAATVAVSQDATRSMQAPIGHRQPRPATLGRLVLAKLSRTIVRGATSFRAHSGKRQCGQGQP
jgi:hypothetical protein